MPVVALFRVHVVAEASICGGHELVLCETGLPNGQFDAGAVTTSVKTSSLSISPPPKGKVLLINGAPPGGGCATFGDTPNATDWPIDGTGVVCCCAKLVAVDSTGAKGVVD